MAGRTETAEARSCGLTWVRCPLIIECDRFIGRNIPTSKDARDGGRADCPGDYDAVWIAGMVDEASNGARIGLKSRRVNVQIFVSRSGGELDSHSVCRIGESWGRGAWIKFSIIGADEFSLIDRFSCSEIGPSDSIVYNKDWGRAVNR